jgi:hypothetical protein
MARTIAAISSWTAVAWAATAWSMGEPRTATGQTTLVMSLLSASPPSLAASHLVR